MSGFEINKILASIILALLVIFGIKYVGNLVVSVDHKENQVSAYKIDIPESDMNTQTVVSESAEIIEPISALLINASLKEGEKLYKKCGSCHNYKKNSPLKVGPNLWNIINRTKGSVDSFSYSNSLLEFGGKWTYEELARFIYNPKNFIEGTKMKFSGLKNVEDRANLIFWLRQNSDNPVPLPE